MVSPDDEYIVGHRFEVYGDRAAFDFIYPRVGQRVQRITVGLEDVRVANEIEIRFDFGRDGWVIESPTKFQWFDGEDTTELQMEEVAFIPAFSERAHIALSLED